MQHCGLTADHGFHVWEDQFGNRYHCPGMLV